MEKQRQQQQPFESTLQDLVYSVDAGMGLKIIRTLLFCLMVLGIVVVYTAREFRGFATEAAMDYGQLGRNMANSNHYITQCVRPVTIATVAAHTPDGDARIGWHPELFRPPLYPALLAANFKFFNLIGINLFPTSEGFRGMRIYPAEQWVAVPLHHLFTVLTGVMLYLLGKRLFSKKIGLLGTTAYFLSEIVWRDGIMGTGIPIFGFFVMGTFYFALLSMTYRRERKSAWIWASLFLVSVVFSAAAFLTNYAALAVIPGVALFIFLMGLRSHRGGHLAFFYLLLVTLLISPWILRNIHVCGMPLGLAPETALIGTDKYPDDSLMRTLSPNFSLISDFRAVKGKWEENFSSLFESNFAVLGSGLLMSFFLVTFFYRFVRVHVHHFRWGVGLSMLIFFIGAGFFGKESFQLYHVFWPFVILYGLAFFSILLDRLDLGIELYKMGLTILVVGLTALPLLATILLSPPPGLPYPPYYVPFVMRVCELLKPSEVMCSDMPWATAWYGQRLSIQLPQTLDDYYEINDYRKYISGLYFTTITKDRPFVSSLVEGPEKSWFPIMIGRSPEGFPLQHGFALNKQDQFFLTDSVRWGADEVQQEKSDAAVGPVAQPQQSE